MPLPVVVGALGGALRLSEHPFIAWVLILSVLGLDAGIIGGGTSFLGLGEVPFVGCLANGAIGCTVTVPLNALGLPIAVSSFHLLVLVALFPLFMLALQKSYSIQR